MTLPECLMADAVDRPALTANELLWAAQQLLTGTAAADVVEELHERRERTADAVARGLVPEDSAAEVVQGVAAALRILEPGRARG